MQNARIDLRAGQDSSRGSPRASHGQDESKRTLLAGFLAIFLLVGLVGWPNCSPAVDGTLKWVYPTGGEVSSSPAIAPNGTIYVGSNDHNLYAINPNGTKKWSYTTGNLVYSSPAIASDGTIYVGSANGKIYAIEGHSELANTAWPMFHHDRKHTGRKP